MDETTPAARDRLIQAIVEEGRRMDGASVVASLDAGLDQLKELLYQRLHDDLQLLSQDSLWMPLSQASELTAQKRTRAHLELYQSIECDQAARGFGYVARESPWFLAELLSHRIGELTDPALREQRDLYLAADDDQRRLAFTDAILEAVPGSRKAPLVLFRLIPLAVHIATALAFDDRATSQQLRRTQRTILPSITDCRVCRGVVLENGQACTVCGNPVWTCSWLTVAD